MNPTTVFQEMPIKVKQRRYRVGRPRTAVLSAAEVKALRRLNIGYGNFIANCRECGLHENTYRYIIDRGYGTMDNVMKIRKTLLK